MLRPGTLALAVGGSLNAKIGTAATSYAAQASCPEECPFLEGGGCYAESGALGNFVTTPLNRSAGLERSPAAQGRVALAEARAIDELEPRPGQALRLHTVGDCATNLAARIVAGAAARWVERGGGPVWTYTHGWRRVERGSWGSVSVLASCETYRDCIRARARGYAPALVVERFEGRRAFRVEGDGMQEWHKPVKAIPCPEQTSGVACTDCRLCFDDGKLRDRGAAVAFSVHGNSFAVKKATLALRTPDDPDRRKTTRELLPALDAAYMERLGRPPTVKEATLELGVAKGTVVAMRRTLRLEAAR